MKDYYTFTNFWITVDNNFIIQERSKYFEEHVKKNSDIIEAVDFVQPKVFNKDQLKKYLFNTILIFKIPSIKFNFRGTLHRADKGILLISWPVIHSFADVRKYSLTEDLRHPNCNLLDILIIKDVLHKQNEVSKEKLRKEFKLKQSIVALTEASKQKSIFLANMSHEIRSPLNLIIGFSEMLDEQISSPHKKEILLKIIQSGNHLNDLVNDILDISKIEGGMFEISMEPENVLNIFDEIKNINDLSGTKKNVELKIDIADSVPEFLMLDKLRFKQIIQNLLSNAFKFCFSNTEILLEASYRDNFLNISVINFGPVIDSSKKNVIFEKFMQEDSSVVKKYGGTGLGLALSRTLAELMEGSLCLDAGFSRGAKFDFSVMAKAVEVKTIKKNKKEIVNSVGEINKVLIVDDDILNFKILKNFLKKFSFEIEHATSGKEALRLIQDNKYELILMDMQMPEMSGEQTTKKIREFELNKYSGPSSYIIAITANAFKEDMVLMLEAGCNKFMTKPVNKKLLINFITQLSTPSKKKDVS